ncbi:hypothetical protein ACFSYD_02445 [Paracoccus aerius]
MPVLSLGIVSLVLAYVLSQFYRAFLAVLTPVLGVELGARPGIWRCRRGCGSRPLRPCRSRWGGCWIGSGRA